MIGRGWIFTDAAGGAREDRPQKVVVGEMSSFQGQTALSTPMGVTSWG
jgi:hypothetical protein